jgi:transcriptional regulator with XRE-family HTH domain
MAKSQHRPHYRLALGLLKQLREEADLTQRELAKRIGRNQVWIHKSETAERRMDITEFLDWCSGCGVDPEDAFRRLIKMRR